jgi:hypothetical protein
MKRLSFSIISKTLSSFLINLKRYVARVGPYHFAAQHHCRHPEQVPNHPHVIAIFDKMHRERVSQNVTTHQLTQSDLLETLPSAGEPYSHDGETVEFNAHPRRL